MRVIHTIASTRLDHGGTSRSVPALCDALAGLGVDVHLAAGQPADSRVACGWPGDSTRVHAVRESPFGRSWGIARRFQRELAALCHAGSETLIHDHGVWLATNHAASVFARNRSIKRIVSPRGMLSSWSLQQGRLKKRAAWWAYQRRDLAAATAFHATSEAEADEIRDLGFNQPIGVISNGIKWPAEFPKRSRPANERIMLFLSRVHPKKGLLYLVQAWQAAAPRAEWRLVIAGPDGGGHRAEVERATAQLGIADRVSFPGEIAEADKWQWYVDADAFVLPSFSENFGLVVAEALAAGTPVLTTTGAPWRELPEVGAGWQVAPTVDALHAALRQITGESREELAAMGRRGADWVRQRFAWSQAAAQMREFYDWLLDRREKPQFVV